MPADDGSFLRRNAFLVAAVSLPVVVIAFFLISTAVPRWLVEAPAHDLLLRAAGAYTNQAAPRVVVEFGVRDGQLQATFRPAADNTYPQRVALFRFDHEAMTVVEIPIELPFDLATDDPPRTVPVRDLEGWRILSQASAPDGYVLETGSGRGPGLVGELFGMRRYRTNVSLVKDGRVVPLELPETFRFNITAIGWLAAVDEGR